MDIRNCIKLPLLGTFSDEVIHARNGWHGYDMRHL